MTAVQRLEPLLTKQAVAAYSSHTLDLAVKCIAALPAETSAVVAEVQKLRYVLAGPMQLDMASPMMQTPNVLPPASWPMAAAARHGVPGSDSAVVTSDLCGPITPSDRFGNWYIVNYTDHASGYVQTYAITKENHQESTTRDSIPFFERQFKVTVTGLRPDRGEYSSKTLTQPRPSKANAHNNSPLEILTGFKPAVSHVLAFGKKKGIEVRGVTGRILGINTEAKPTMVVYRVVKSRHVQNMSPSVPKNVQGLQLKDDMTLEHPTPPKSRRHDDLARHQNGLLCDLPDVLILS
ncbi:hypothetical protein SDRG_13379 [Saprolegnia diclina VS20]|uniref:Integrase catalytic domain-containing protein n=1 Tax=Saprolegnia diclina (strain VS20) TaxID=1156394 RepID=T0PTP3_SAPDV|nr:hypothetical protein SDRG_13379 [Saprolegnia diclina VS20]EQC28869.1 hypothetical protein SDRG_13379 [Saprolegnia diclina VS20]|eukprot:XP_008617686.1 hypothetical protein SDRG_13379 [Saprolegnia diclina VS20]